MKLYRTRTQEEWKPIKEYEGLYEVSSRGRVKRLGRIVTDSLGRERLIKEIMLTPQVNIKTGYVYIHIGKREQRRLVSLHRLVAKAFIPKEEGKPYVNHIDGDKENNNVENLEWVTAQENTQHAYEKGLLKNYGEGNGASVLTDEQAKRIRVLYRQKSYTQDELAELYGVSQGTVSYIVRNISYVNPIEKGAAN